MDKTTDKDLYETLHISKDATDEEIKRAYRRLARIYHPDINESNESKKIFNNIRQAYDVLSDPNKRKIYDLKNGFNKPEEISEKEEPPEPPKTEEAKSSETKSFTKRLTDILDGIFIYVKKAGNTKNKENDIYADVTISPKEALLGTNRIINVMQTTLCPNCYGKKFINEALCPLCKGTGEISTHKRINAKIPSNTKNGDKIKIEGSGNKPVNNEKPGDLFLIISIDEKSLFTVKDSTVYMDLPISTFEAALGATIEIPTFYENIIIKIPPNTSSGQRFRLNGQGIFDKETGLYGDMIVTVIIKLPPKLSSKEIELYKELEKNNNYNVREGLKDIE